MEFSQMRDGSLMVYVQGVWVGTAVPHDGSLWSYFDRFRQVIGISTTPEGAVLTALFDTDEEEEEQ